jgi:alpha-tubulin suppressor-like RCC1 family protein
MAWGCGRNGRLGTGDFGDSLIPVRCRGLYDYVLAGVGCGRSHTLIFDNKGTVLSLGSGLHGRLGRPVSDGENCVLPQIVPGLEAVHVVAVAAGERHTLLLSKEGNVYSFGDGSMGQLGHGEGRHTSITGLATPTRIEAFRYFAPRGGGGSGGGGGGGATSPGARIEPVTTKPVTLIAAGAFHSAALTSDGQVWLWGRGKDGQLGKSVRKDSFVPETPTAAMVDGQAQGLYAKQVWHMSGLVLGCGEQALNFLVRRWWW